MKDRPVVAGISSGAYCRTPDVSSFLACNGETLAASSTPVNCTGIGRKRGSFSKRGGFSSCLSLQRSAS